MIFLGGGGKGVRVSDCGFSIPDEKGPCLQNFTCLKSRKGIIMKRSATSLHFWTTIIQCFFSILESVTTNLVQVIEMCSTHQESADACL